MIKSAQRMKKYVLKVEFEKLIFRIGFTVVTTSLCQKLFKKLERLYAKEVYTFIMDSEAIFY